MADATLTAGPPVDTMYGDRTTRWRQGEDRAERVPLRKWLAAG